VWLVHLTVANLVQLTVADLELNSVERKADQLVSLMVAMKVEQMAQSKAGQWVVQLVALTADLMVVMSAHTSAALSGQHLVDQRVDKMGPY
jgi:hypothetical protein